MSFLRAVVALSLVIACRTAALGASPPSTPPENQTLPEIVGLDTVGSALSATAGAWDGSPTTYTYNWHSIGGPSLGTGSTFGPLTAAMIGQRLQVDVTATNSSGSATATSDFIGPVESALPAPPTLGAGAAPTALPVYPANFLENGHAIYPGCPVPPAAPDTSNPSHVWYFDPVAGRTLAQGATGHAGDPFKDASAIFGGVPGYGSVAGLTSVNGPDGANRVHLRGTSFGLVQGGGKVFIGGVQASVVGWSNTAITVNMPVGAPSPTLANTEVAVGLFSRLIAPGAVIYAKPDPTGASVGSLISSFTYSTSDGTSTGAVQWTWILRDPTATAAPVFTQISLAAVAGFVFTGINVENDALQTSVWAAPYLATGASMVNLSGALGAPGKGVGPTHDVVFENMSLSGWVGHSADPWNPSTYPAVGGHSDGTIETASPYMGAGTGDPQSISVTAAAGATQLFLNTGVPLWNVAPSANIQPLIYAWSPGYYYQQNIPMFPTAAPANTGIPNGTVVKNVQGRTDLTHQGTLTAATTTELNNGVTPTVRGVVKRAGALPETGGRNDFWIVASSPQTFSNLYTWCVVPSATTCPTGVNRWVSLGTFLPAIATNAFSWFMSNTKHLWIGDATPTWVDSGAAYLTIGPCDVINNHNSGCPSALTANGTPFVGCDPKIGSSGGCGERTPPLWNGTTRALSNEYLEFTPRMHIAPSGWWNHVDWDYAVSGFSMTGTMGAGSADLKNPNDVRGNSCVSLKNNTIRYNRNQIANSLMQNSVEYGNRLKYRTGDAFKVYSSHRIIIANNFTSDVTFIKEHQDILQYGQSSGSAASVFYGNVAVNNEGYTHTDTNDQFVNYTQAIGATDQIYSGTYVCCNIIFNSANPVYVGGLFNVVVHNDVFNDGPGPGTLKIASGGKANRNLPAYSMLANNVSNGIARNGQVPGALAKCSAAQNTVSHNVVVSTMDWATGTPSIGNSTYCGNSNGVVNTSSAGAFPDLVVWAPADLRSGSANPLFSGLNPVPPLPQPAPGVGLISANSCLRNEVKVGSCSPNDIGRQDMRPNPRFVPTTPDSVRQATNVNNLPTTGAIGDRWLTASAAACGSGFRVCSGGFVGKSFPSGIYTRVSRATTMAGYGAVASPFNSNVGPFTPGIIGAGVNLGAQQPPANHGRQPWTNPPNAGAY